VNPARTAHGAGVADPRPGMPDRVTVSTCIGCGAMSKPGECPGCCSQERRLELVPAFEHDRLADQNAETAGQVAELRATVERFLAGATGVRDAAQALAGARQEARATLATLRSSAPPLPEDDVEPSVAWWCERCGGIDAPAPCIGVCIRKPAEWVNARCYQHERAHGVRLLAERRGLIATVRALAFTSPRPGQEERHLRALSERALSALHGASQAAGAA